MDAGTIATSIGAGSLIAYNIWRDGIAPRLRRRADSVRPSQLSQETQAVTELRVKVDELTRRVGEFAEQIPHLASADEVATYSSTTTQTLIQLTGKIERLAGILEGRK